MSIAENWSHYPYPPKIYEIVGRKVISQTYDYQEERVWIKGHHPHLGKIIKGTTGPETEVHRSVIHGRVEIHRP